MLFKIHKFLFDITDLDEWEIWLECNIDYILPEFLEHLNKSIIDKVADDQITEYLFYLIADELLFKWDKQVYYKLGNLRTEVINYIWIRILLELNKNEGVIRRNLDGSWSLLQK